MCTITMKDRGGLLSQSGQLSRRGLSLVLAGAVERLSTTLIRWHERACERRQLLALSDAALKDFGACRVDAANEGDNPFWRG
jgi:uncharacterized protein YjiS (DUF1127 family)